MLLKSNVVKQLSSIMIHISHSCWRHVMMRPLMSDRLLCMALVFVQSLVDLCSSLWCLSMMNPVHNNCLLTLEMFFKCYCSIASEFLFYRKLVIVTLDRFKRGRGPIVVTTVGTTLVVVLSSSLYSIAKIQNRTVEAGILNPTDQVLMSKHILEASLMGFVLFLSLMIDRLHHYIRELRLLRKTMEAVKKQSRSFEDGKNGNSEEHKTLTEEIATLKAKIKELESVCEVKGSQAKALETEVEALKKQSEEFLRAI